MCRLAILVVMLGSAAACAAPRARPPAWPKMATRDADGGESLAPRTGATSVAAAAADDDGDDDIKVVPAATETKAATPDAKAPAATTPAAATPEEPITIDDIVI